MNTAPMDPRETTAPPQAAESIISEVYAGAAGGQLQLPEFQDSKLLLIPGKPREEREHQHHRQQHHQQPQGSQLFVPVEDKPDLERDSASEQEQGEVVVSTLPKPGHHGQHKGTVISSLRPNQGWQATSGLAFCTKY